MLRSFKERGDVTYLSPEIVGGHSIKTFHSEDSGNIAPVELITVWGILSLSVKGTSKHDPRFEVIVFLFCPS